VYKSRHCADSSNVELCKVSKQRCRVLSRSGFSPSARFATRIRLCCCDGAVTQATIDRAAAAQPFCKENKTLIQLCVQGIGYSICSVDKTANNCQHRSILSMRCSLIRRFFAVSSRRKPDAIKVHYFINNNQKSHLTYGSGEP
jgi:hypothetical protein